MAKEYFEIVDGYVFRSPQMAQQARKELEGILFVKKQMDMKNPQAILQVYNRIIDEDLFHTEVGYSFLRQLQEYLKANPEIENETVRALEIYKEQPAEGAKTKENVTNGMHEKMKHRLATAYIVIGMLGVLVLAMIFIMRNSDNATILDYENKVIDRYEHWQEELQEREEELEEREEELEEREEAIEEKEKELGIRP